MQKKPEPTEPTTTHRSSPGLAKKLQKVRSRNPQALSTPVFEPVVRDTNWLVQQSSGFPVSRASQGLRDRTLTDFLFSEKLTAQEEIGLLSLFKQTRHQDVQKHLEDYLSLKYSKKLGQNPDQWQSHIEKVHP